MSERSRLQGLEHQDLLTNATEIGRGALEPFGLDTERFLKDIRVPWKRAVLVPAMLGMLASACRLAETEVSPLEFSKPTRFSTATATLIPSPEVLPVGGGEEPEVTITPSSEPTVTIRPTETLEPTAILEPTPILEPSPTLEPTKTETLEPTATATETPEPLVEYYSEHFEQLTQKEIKVKTFEPPFKAQFGVEGKITDEISIIVAGGSGGWDKAYRLFLGEDSGKLVRAVLVSDESAAHGWQVPVYKELEDLGEDNTLKISLEDDGKVYFYHNDTPIYSTKEKFGLADSPEGGRVLFEAQGTIQGGENEPAIDLKVLLSQEALEKIPTATPVPTREPVPTIPEKREDWIAWWANNVPLENFTAEEAERLRRVMKEWLPKIPTQMEMPPEAAGYQPMFPYGDVVRAVLNVRAVRKDPTLTLELAAATGDDRITLLSPKVLGLVDCNLAQTIIKEAWIAQMVVEGAKQGVTSFKRARIEADSYLVGLFALRELRKYAPQDQWGEIDFLVNWYVQQFHYWSSKL